MCVPVCMTIIMGILRQALQQQIRFICTAHTYTYVYVCYSHAHTHTHSPSAFSIFSSDNSPFFQACENNFAFALTFSNTSRKSDGFIVNGKSLRLLITATTPPSPSASPCSLLFLQLLLLFVYCCFGRLATFACFLSAPPSLDLCLLFMYVSVSLSFCISVCLSVSLCVCLSLCMPAPLSFCLSSLPLSLCLSTPLSLSVCLSVSMSLCLY